MVSIVWHTRPVHPPRSKCRDSMRLDTKKSTITTTSTAEERNRRFLSVMVYLASSSGSLLRHSSEVGRTLVGGEGCEGEGRGGEGNRSRESAKLD